MGGKNIWIAAVAVLVLAAGAYFVAGSSSPSIAPEAGSDESAGQETPTQAQGASNTGGGSASKSSGGTSAAPSAPSAAPPSSILGTQWTWQSTEFTNGSRTVPEDSAQFLITFGEDKQMTSMTDCNNIFSPFSVSGANLKIGPIAATDMACPQATAERIYTEDLARVASYATTGDELRLIFTNGVGTMTFKRYAAVGLEGTTFRLISFNGNVIAGSYTILLDDGLLSAKFCNTLGGAYTLAAGRVTANVSGTKMSCGTPPGLMEAENIFISTMRDGLQVSLKGTLLTLTGDEGEQFVFGVVGN